MTNHQRASKSGRGLSKAAAAGAVIATASLVASGLAGPAAADDEPWGKRQLVNRDYLESDHVDAYTELEMAADGTAIAVWERRRDGRFLIEGARRPAGGRWSNPTVVADIYAVGGAGLSDAFADAAGNVTVGYGEQIDGTFRAMVVTWQSDGTVGPATELDRGSPGGPQLFGDPSGDVLAMVHYGDSATYYRPAGGAWSAPAVFPPDTGASVLDIVLGPGDEVTAVFGGYGAYEEIVRAASLVGTSWESVVPIADGRGRAKDLDADINADGDIGVSWVRETEAHAVDDRIESVYRAAGQDWGAVKVVRRALQPVPDSVTKSKVGLAADGTMTVAWRERLDLDRPVDNQVIHTRTRTPNGTWTARRAPARRCNSFGLQLSVNDRGDALIVCDWYMSSRPGVLAVYRPAGGTWSRPERLWSYEIEGGDLLSHESVLSEAGEAVMTYRSTASLALWSRSAQIAARPGG